jgi:tRNA-modifying protein YgfZ
MSAVSHTSSLSVSEALNAARTSVAVFDVSDRTQIEVTGSDRVRFLHSFTSNDIKGLKPGQGCETFVTNLKGKVAAHVFVFCGEKSHWLDGTPGQQSAIISHLGKFVLIDDVQLIPRTDERGELFVTGPLAAQLLQLDEGTKVGNTIQRETENGAIHIRRVDLLGSPGFLLSVPCEQTERVKLSLRGLGVAEGTRELFEMLRIEAGYPLYGVDITDDHLAQEVARTKQCVSFNKGCYLGQETIARLDALGHTNRELRPLQFESKVVPMHGTVVYDSAGTTEIGLISSAAIEMSVDPTQASQSVVSLGMIKRPSCQPETPVCLMLNGERISGKVR